MQPLLEVRRGPVLESLHRGAVAAVDPGGRVVASAGDVEFVCYPRSAAKPFQALPFVASGGADALGLSEAEVALMAGSHGGEAVHTETALRILRRAGLDAGALACGAHAPYDDRARAAIGAAEPTALHNNCSGKHAGMLAAAVHGGHPTDTYLDPGHPVQRAILDAVSRFSGVPGDEIPVAVDGCSAPIFAVSVRAQALMFARLVNPEGMGDADARAARRIAAAMAAHPEMVGASERRIDTDLMREAGGRAVAKSGAEGVECMGIFPCEAYPGGLGVAVKIEDGDAGGRARGVVFAEVARQLLGLALPGYARHEIRNRRGDVVGELRPVFTLR